MNTDKDVKSKTSCPSECGWDDTYASSYQVSWENVCYCCVLINVSLEYHNVIMFVHHILEDLAVLITVSHLEGRHPLFHVLSTLRDNTRYSHRAVEVNHDPVCVVVFAAVGCPCSKTIVIKHRVEPPPLWSMAYIVIVHGGCGDPGIWYQISGGQHRILTFILVAVTEESDFIIFAEIVRLFLVVAEETYIRTACIHHIWTVDVALSVGNHSALDVSHVLSGTYVDHMSTSAIVGLAQWVE